MANNNYKRSIFISMILIALGVTMNNLIKSDVSSVGTVFIAVGGLFFIIGMSKQKKEDQKVNSKE